jgi:hypothetical protein
MELTLVPAVEIEYQHTDWIFTTILSEINIWISREKGATRLYHGDLIA